LVFHGRHDNRIAARLFRTDALNRKKVKVMNKDRIAGVAKQAKGAVKEAAGRALGDAKMTAEGKSDKAEGVIQNAVGAAKDALKT
jgi:uncharacterized protein YjbJ (UPF0337 family)